MFRSTTSLLRSARRLLPLAALSVGSALLAGCTVITVAGAAVGVAAAGVGLAVDAGVGAVKLTGKAVGAVLPSSDE